MKKQSIKISFSLVSKILYFILILSLIPVFVLSTYNHACYDDFGFSINTREAWVEHGTFFSVLSAAIQNTITIRNTWEGTYSTSFLSALQPGLFNNNAYWITTVLLLGTLLISFWYFSTTINKLIDSQNKAFRLILFSLLAFIAIQFVPSANEAFFWYNGGVAYTFFWAIGLIHVSLILKLIFYKNHLSIIKIILLFLSSIILGGSKYSTALFFLLVDCSLLLFAFLLKKKNCKLILSFSTLTLLGFLIFSAIAPGNMVRAESLHSSNISLFSAIAQSIFFGSALFSSWFTLPVLILFCFSIYLGKYIIQNSKIIFFHPLIIFPLSFILFCSQLSPTIFTGNYLGDGRVLNTYYYTYLVFIIVIGLSIGCKLIPIKHSETKIPLATFLTFMLILIVGIIGYQPKEAQSYGPQHTLSGSALRSLVNGQAQEFSNHMQTREENLVSNKDTTVFLTPFYNVPKLFMDDSLTNSNINYVLHLYADYYNVQNVQLK